MKGKGSTYFLVLFLGIITAVFLSAAPVNAFWYGDQMPAIVPLPTGPMDMDSNYQDLDAELHKEGGILTGMILNAFFNQPVYPVEGLIKYDRKKSWGGYTLLSSVAGGYCSPDLYPDGCGDDPEKYWSAILIDMRGNVINGWPGNAFPAKLLPGGHVLMARGVLEGGNFESARFVQMNWDREIVWEWESMEEWDCSEGNDHPRCVDGKAHSGQHHDWQREGNPVGYYAPGLKPKLEGKTLILYHWLPPKDQTDGTFNDGGCPYADGCYDISNFRLLDDAIYEVAKDGETILFKWHAYQHFTPATDKDLGMGFNAVETAGIKEVRVFLEDPEENATDYHHINSASYLGPNKWWKKYRDYRFHPDNIIWDGRQSNITAIIARHDFPQAGITQGDIVWRVGPDYGPAVPAGKLRQIIGQHQAHMIPRGLPGAGNILMFDNGGMAGWGPFYPGMPDPVRYAPMPFPFDGFFGAEVYMGSKFRDYSRVIEFNPITLEMVWEYKSLAPNNEYGNMYSAFISGAQRLLNGNTMICEGAAGRVFEVRKNGEIVWEFVTPDEFVEGPPQGPPLAGQPMYRAYRVPEEWLPIAKKKHRKPWKRWRH